MTASLAVLSLLACDGSAPRKAPSRTGDRIVIAVSGMSCGSCEAAIEGAAMKYPDVNAVEASAPEGEVVLWIKPGSSADPIVSRIKALGFTPAAPPQPE